MALPASLAQLALPVIASPLFIASTPELVLAQCTAGIVGAFPALNARPAEQLGLWLQQLDEGLAAYRALHPQAPVGPYAVNQIVHPSNDRLAHDVALCVQHQVPLIISSLQAPPAEMLSAVHGYGGLVFHDVISVRHARKALQAGVDGLILVAAGAGGHAGTLSPFALVHEVRQFFDGPLVLAGAMASGEAILAAQACGADLAYMGTLWLSTPEANTSPEYKQALLEATAQDVIYTNLFTGVHGNYLRQSIVKAGLDPDHLPQADKSQMNFGSGSGSAAKAWRDIWGAGQGVGGMHELQTVAQVVARLQREYQAAFARLQQIKRP